MFFRLFSATAVGENPSDCVCTKCCRAWKKVAICVCEKFLFVMTQKRETATRCIRCEFKQFYCREPSPSSAGCSVRIEKSQRARRGCLYVGVRRHLFLCDCCWLQKRSCALSHPLSRAHKHGSTWYSQSINIIPWERKVATAGDTSG